ncbi:MAG: Fe-S cluster assembly protein SufD [Acidiphilium sp.]|nr:Fe-S cluster assembly protein SufD [Acidiphilium sp.]MDD4934968.1 Fe-S cluster assembly protein SufD [Acidiphilium sp.]
MNVSDFLDRIDFSALAGPAQRRVNAVERFRAQGWPTRADEAWHYTDLRGRLKNFEFALPIGTGNAFGMMPVTSSPCVTFANGRYAETHSTTLSFVTPHGGDVACEAGSDLPMVAVNAAIATGGALFNVPNDVDAGTVFLVSLADAANQLAIASRHRISVGVGASLTLIEISRGMGEYLHNSVIEIVLAKGAMLRHYRMQDEAADAVHVTTIFVDIAADAKYESFILNYGARLSRNEVHVSLAGAGGEVSLGAAQLLSGMQHGDITTIITHDAPHCASRQTVKSVLGGAARGVFQGRIKVARAAQKTDGYQMNQALLLSPDAEIDCKPELEIFADDVKCSHGATIGALDPEQMFYLRSRGIPEEQARVILIRAFLDGALESVADQQARAVFENAIEAWRLKGMS